jgi:hypothetical protein
MDVDSSEIILSTLTPNEPLPPVAAKLVDETTVPVPVAPPVRAAPPSSSSPARAPEPMTFAKTASSLSFDPSVEAAGKSSSRPAPAGSARPAAGQAAARVASGAEEAWANGGGSEPPGPLARIDGKSFVVRFAAAVFAFSAILIASRMFYRGKHDTNAGLALKPPPSASVAVAASVAAVAVAPPDRTPPTPKASPPPAVSSSPPVNVEPAAPIATAAPVASTVVATNAASAKPDAPAPKPAPRPAADVAAASNPTPATTAAPAVAAASASPKPAAAGSGLSSESIARAAERALEDKDEKQGMRAAQIAFIATRQDPTNAGAWLTLGSAYEAIGKKQQALDSYRACVRQASSHPRVGECKQRAAIQD